MVQADMSLVAIWHTLLVAFASAANELAAQTFKFLALFAVTVCS